MTIHSTPLGRVASPGSTGIRVIIVGCGFAGLSCAIECKRKGHDVLLLEKFDELKPLGEFHILRIDQSINYMYIRRCTFLIV